MISLKSGFVFIATTIAYYVIERWLNLLENLVPDFLPHLNVVDVIFLGIVGFGIYLVLRNQFTKSNNEKIDDTNKKIHNELIEDKISAYKPLLDALINMNQRFYKINNSNSDDEKKGEAAMLKNLIPTKFRILKDNNRLNSDVSKQYDVYCDMMESNHLIPDMMESNHLIPDMMESTHLIPDINSYKQMIQKLIDELEKYIPSELVSNLDELKNNVK